MTKKKVTSNDSAELRRRAQERLGEKAASPLGTEEESLRLLHELQVHQVELEMQNAELRQTRDALEKALDRHSRLYDFAPVGFFTLDLKGTILNVNLTGASLVGVERSQLVGKRFGLLIADEARPAFNSCFGKVFTEQDKVSCEVALQKDEKTKLHLQVEGVADKLGQEFYVALIDITERKNVKEALRLAKEAAEQARCMEKEAAETLRLAKEAAETLRLKNEAAEALRLEKEAAALLRLEKEAAEEKARLKNQFLVNMSHELRTPMTGILGMLQFALEEDLSPVLREYLDTTMSSARALLRILNDILDLAIFESGKLIIEEKPFSPQNCIAEAVDIITPEVRRKGLDFALSVAEEVPDTAVGDQMRLRQVLINVIGNAVKFTEGGKVVVRVTAGKATSKGKREFTFSVTDTGIGIPDDKKELLFRAFSQVDASLTRQYGGTGLGLAISREIVELMGGKITFVSEEGVGSTFSITIPLAEVRLESAALTAAESQSSEAIISAQAEEKIPHILFAEDDPVIKQILGLLFKRSNYNLDVAEDGRQAVEMWEKGGYDLILMDVQMPRLNGYEATRAIREKESERGGHIPIIAMTAHTSKEDEEKCLAAGMDAYLSKPIDFEKSLQLIGDIIRQAAALEPH